MTGKQKQRTAGFSMAVLAGLIGGLGALVTGPVAALADTVTNVSTLSQANRLSLFHDYSIDAVGLTRSSGLSPVPGDRSLEFSASPIVGYDSNPEAHPKAVGGLFAGVDLDAAYRINLGPDDATLGNPTQFKFEYNAVGAVYEGTVFQADTFQQTLSGSYRRSLLHDSLFVGVALDDQFTTEHGSAFLNTFDLGPSVEWFATPQVSLEADYDYTRLDFFLRSVPRRNPDSNRHTVNAKLHFYSFPQQRGDVPESPDVLGDILRSTFSRATIGYAAVFNRALGIDNVYEANRLSIGFEGIKIPRVKNVTFDANYAHEWDNYMSPSTQGPLVIAGKPKQRRRKDHVDVFTLRMNAKLLEFTQNRGVLSSYLQWDLIGDRSNIPARDYNEFVISGGVNYRY